MKRVAKSRHAAVFKRGDQLVYDGVPFYASLPIDFETCCDCARAHRIRYDIEDANGNRIKGARLKITVWSDEVATKERRSLPLGVIGRPGFWIDVEDVKRARSGKRPR